MTDLSPGARTRAPLRRLAQIDRAALAALVILLGVALLTPHAVAETLHVTLSALAETAPFILFAVLAVALLRATGAERVMARLFTGSTARMILVGALLGGLSPFCSCEVIPFIAALLAVGAPLAGVMAFWLASPLMDPAMFSITAAELGWAFAAGKAAAAVGIGLLGGLLVSALARARLLREPLRAGRRRCSSSCAGALAGRPPVWAFWRVPERCDIVRSVVQDQIMFLGKWLFLAYLVEAVMVRHLPAGWIAGTLGSDGPMPVILGALLGGPLHLNGYAAASLLGGLVAQGMSEGAAMAFMIAGGVSCIPAAVAVAALVRPRVLALYLATGIAGAMLAGGLWAGLTLAASGTRRDRPADPWCGVAADASETGLACTHSDRAA